MEDSISQLSQLLQHPDDNIVSQASEICKNVSADAASCTQILPLLPELLRVTSTPTKEAASNSLIALINITSHLPAAIDRLIGLNAVTRLMDAVISHDATLVHSRLMLLTNLTTQNSGCLQILDLQDRDLKGQRLLRLAVKFTQPADILTIPKAQPLHGLNLIAEAPGDEFEYAAMVLMNATLLPEGREIFFSTPDFFMPSLLSAASGDNPIRKQGIIGVLRNLCFDQSRHEFLLKKAKILPYLVRPLLSKSIEGNESAVNLLQKAFPGIVFGNPEPVAVNRKNLLESLFMLTQSEVGKSDLVQHHVVFVMRELDEYESDEENKQLGLRISAILIPQGAEAVSESVD
jgi:hypothetical protein